MPPFQRKTLVLIGAQGVGRRSLKNRLTVINPLKYGTTVPCELTHTQVQARLLLALGSYPSESPNMNTPFTRTNNVKGGIFVSFFTSHLGMTGDWIVSWLT